MVLLDCVHKTPPKASSGMPYLAIPQMKTGTIDLRATRRITKQDYVDWTQKADPQAHDVVLSRRCNPGVTAAVPQGVKFALGQNLVLLRADGSRMHRPFLKWVVRTRQWWTQVGKFINVGAVFESLRCADVPKFEVHLPPLAEQRRIAGVLGALDDKIELNRKMNQTLEEMAQAIFKSWFIDFDGVSPEDMVDSELGPIPKGWGVGTLGDVMELKRGHDLPKRLRRPGRVPIVSSSGTTGWHDESKAKGPGVVTGRYGTIGKVFYVEGDYWPLNTTLYVRDFKGNEPRFAHYLLQTINFQAYTDKAAVPGINRNHVHLEPVAVAPVEKQIQFSGTMEALWRQRRLNDAESQTLTDLRDALLPKLISGEVRVPVAEKALEAVL